VILLVFGIFLAAPLLTLPITVYWLCQAWAGYMRGNR